MERNFNDLIAAYCVGCLDSESLKELTDYIRSGGQLNFQELGEFQNLIALLPSTLTLEQPGPDVKDKVARKLYKMRDEVKKARKSTFEKKLEKESEKEPEKQPEAESKAEPETQIEREQIGEKVHVLSPRRTAEYQRPPHDTQIKGRTSGNLYTPYHPEQDKKARNKQKPVEEPEVNLTNPDNEFSPVIHEDEELSNVIKDETEFEVKVHEQHYYKEPEEPVKRKRNYPLMIGGVLLFILVIIAIVFAYTKLTSDVQQYKKEVERLNKKVNSLTMQLSSNQEIQSMLNSPNIQIIKLEGTEINKTGYGKLILNPDKGMGFIQLANMPVLPDNMVYQLWLNLSGSLTSLGTFRPEDSIGYYSFQMPEIPGGYNTKFLVTGEPETGSKKPGYKIYLTGTL